jgi:hypothetical protein
VLFSVVAWRVMHCLLRAKEQKTEDRAPALPPKTTTTRVNTHKHAPRHVSVKVGREAARVDGPARRFSRLVRRDAAAVVRRH